MLLDFVRLPWKSKQEVLLNNEIALKKIKRMNREKILVALIYHQILKDGLAITARELSRMTGYNRKEIFKTYKFLKPELKLKNISPDPKNFLQKYCSFLNLSQKTVIASNKILKNIEFDFGLSTKISIAIYLSSLINNEKVTQEKISEVCGISIQTLRTGLRKLRQQKGFNKETSLKY